MPRSAGVFILLLIFSCSSQKISLKSNFLCSEHGTHNAADASSFAECFGISAKELQDYKIFSNKSDGIKKENLEGEKKRLKDLLSDNMVDLIMILMKKYYGDAITSSWSLERTTMPVKYRFFIQEENGKYNIHGYGIMLNSDLEARSLLRFLPLEYKMNFLHVKEGEMNSADPRDLRKERREP